MFEIYKPIMVQECFCTIYINFRNLNLRPDTVRIDNFETNMRQLEIQIKKVISNEKKLLKLFELLVIKPFGHSAFWTRKFLDLLDMGIFGHFVSQS